MTPFIIISSTLRHMGQTVLHFLQALHFPLSAEMRTPGKRNAFRSFIPSIIKGAIQQK
jgi:hypothetical protein